jgi:hypothetical protein
MALDKSPVYFELDKYKLWKQIENSVKE